jgi:8-oxo-dGTP pyrophosphatase MutT (NUDIX family)
MITNTYGSGVIMTHGNKVLLLEGANTGIWSFPKGHPEVEDCSSALRTAIRETWEETGFIYGVDYHIIGQAPRIGRRVYWDATTKMNKEPVLRSREHRSWRWVSPEEIMTLQVNSDVKKWVSRVVSV